MMKQILLGILAALTLTACAAAQTYIVTDIGVLKGDTESSGFWINSSGAVVGCADTANSEGYPCTGTGAGQHAFYWTKSGGLKDLGTLPGGNISGAIGLNDAEPCAESGLIQTLTLAGSAANSLRAFQIAKASGFKSKVTFLVSPGAIATVLNPFSMRSGSASLVP